MLTFVLLIAFIYFNQQPKQVSVHEVDWDFLNSSSNSFLIEYIYVYDKNETEPLLLDEVGNSFMNIVFKDPNLVFSEKHDNTVKVFVKFVDIPFIDLVYGIRKFDNQECTFYVDETLLEELIDISFDRVNISN